MRKPLRLDSALYFLGGALAVLGAILVLIHMIALCVLYDWDLTSRVEIHRRGRESSYPVVLVIVMEATIILSLLRWGIPAFWTANDLAAKSRTDGPGRHAAPKH